MDDGGTIGFVMDGSWTLPNLVDYEKFHLWAREVVWINYGNNEVCGSILRDCVKKNIKYWVWWIMELFWVFWAQDKVL